LGKSSEKTLLSNLKGEILTGYPLTALSLESLIDDYLPLRDQYLNPERVRMAAQERFNQKCEAVKQLNNNYQPYPYWGGDGN